MTLIQIHHCGIQILFTKCFFFQDAIEDQRRREMACQIQMEQSQMFRYNLRGRIFRVRIHFPATKDTREEQLNIAKTSIHIRSVKKLFSLNIYIYTRGSEKVLVKPIYQNQHLIFGYWKTEVFFNLHINTQYLILKAGFFKYLSLEAFTSFKEI